nr:MAG TPA: hypothetical protein [Caudoviricetes sp.]
MASASFLSIGIIFFALTKPLQVLVAWYFFPVGVIYTISAKEITVKSRKKR